MQNNLFKLFILFLISLAIIKYILSLNILGFWKLLLSLFFLYVTSLYIKRILPNAKEELIPGLLMIRTKKWLEDLKKLTPLSEFLEVLSNLTFFVLFGLPALMLAKWIPVKKRIVYYISSLVFLYAIILIYPFALLTLPVHGTTPSSNQYAVFILLFGLMGVIVYSFSLAVFKTIISLINKTSLPTTITPLLPGITLPFFEGVIALGVVLIIHELSHAIMSLRYNIPIKSTGLITYGVLPLGAFVEPDEKQFASAPGPYKLNILLAGPAINLFFGVIFFGIFLLFLIFSTPFAVDACYVVKGAPKGTIITKINNIPCIYSFKSENSIMTTNKGNITWSNETYYIPIGKESMIRYYSLEFFNFLYNLLYMLFSLNLLLGLANLFPVFLFDGGQIVKELGDIWKKPHISLFFVGIFSLMLLFVVVTSMF